MLASGKVDITYHYDSVGRLMMRRDNYGSTLQLIYSNVMRPQQITHVYNFTSRVLHSLLYDDQGYLLAIDTGMSAPHGYICPGGMSMIYIYVYVLSLIHI